MYDDRIRIEKLMWKFQIAKSHSHSFPSSTKKIVSCPDWIFCHRENKHTKKMTIYISFSSLQRIWDIIVVLIIINVIRLTSNRRFLIFVSNWNMPYVYELICASMCMFWDFFVQSTRLILNALHRTASHCTIHIRALSPSHM